MLYGFITEDLRNLEKNDPFYLQVQFAKRIDKYCELCIADERILDKFGNCVSVENETVFLRSTCDNVNKGFICLKSVVLFY